jgi:hypothetical protein
MHPQLQELTDQFTAARARLHRLVDSVPAARFAERPPAGGWSPAECVAHLNLSARAYIPPVREQIARARTLGVPARPRYQRGVLGWLLWRMMGPRQGVRMKTTATFLPGGDQPVAELVAEFDRLQDEQMELVRISDGLPIDRVMLVSPFDARVKYNAFAALGILANHQHRHLDQAERAWAAVSGKG